MARTENINESKLACIIVSEVESTTGGWIELESAKRNYKALIIGYTGFLGMVKNSKTPTALVIEDKEGNFIVAAVVEYNEESEQEETGNWNYFWTFYKEDIPENATVYDIKSKQCHTTICEVANKFERAQYAGSEALISMSVIAFSTLREYLTQNANNGDGGLELVYDNVFKASSTVDGEDVKLSFIPDGQIKKMIKDDKANEKAN